MAYYYRHSPISDDYCAYITKMERKTSMCEGPHFPRGMFKDKAPQDLKPDAGKEKTSMTSVGRFGRAAHIEYESRGASTDEDVEVDAGEYVKQKHHRRFGLSSLSALMLHKRMHK